MTTNEIIGVSLGVFMGLLAGICAYGVLKKMDSPNLSVPDFLKLAAWFIGIPAACFGGPWVAGGVLAGVNWDEIRGTYLPTLALVFLLLTAVPIYRLVRRF